MYVLLKIPFNPFDKELYLFIEFLFYDPIVASVGEEYVHCFRDFAMPR